jgi:hypothetical protein
VYPFAAMADRASTHNKRINRLSAIQENKMIVRAVEHGVSKEALDMLKDQMVSSGMFQNLKKMKAMSQIECADLMNSMYAYTFS